MGINGINSVVDIAVSGLRASALKMEVGASNIANANTTRTETGEPYRRKTVVLSTLLSELQGVNVVGVTQDHSTDFNKVLLRGHPDADADGYVLMPNVDLPLEMTRMITASRAYQANAVILKRYQDSMDITLELLR